MKRALIIRHASPETLAANFQSILVEKGFNLVPSDIFQTAPAFDEFSPPEISEVSLVITLGGPMSANDDFPALHLERDYLSKAMALGVPVLGVCLGAQLMATALGGTVEPTGGFHFGLRQILVTAEGDADPVFNKIRVPLVPASHGDCFSVPQGAVKLAESDMLCRDGSYRRINMAFRQGNSYGFQFEPQLTLDELRVWNTELGEDYKLMGDRFDADEEAARHLREYARFAPIYESQMGEMLLAFLSGAGLV